MGFEFLFLIVLLIALPFLFLLPLYASGRRQANAQLASIKPLLSQWGFQRTSWFEQTRLGFLYKTTGHTHPIYVSLKTLPHGSANKLLTFLVFWVEIPLKSSLFIRAANLESEENDLLYETYWKRVPSDMLAPLGLRTLCASDSRTDWEHRLLSEPVQRMLAGLIAQKDLFYIYGDAEHGFLELGFALPRSPEPQRIRRWFDTAIGLAPILHESNRRGQVRRNRSLTGFFLLLMFLGILFIGLLLFISVLGGA